MILTKKDQMMKMFDDWSPTQLRRDKPILVGNVRWGRSWKRSLRADETWPPALMSRSTQVQLSAQPSSSECSVVARGHAGCSRQFP